MRPVVRLRPGCSIRGACFFFLRESRLIQSFNVDSAHSPQMFGKGVLALKRQPNDGSHPTDIAGGWCGFKMDHRCWCFVGQKPVSLQGLHRCSQMSKFCSQTTFIEKAFSRNLLPEFQRVPSLNKTALIGSLDPLQLLGTPRVYPPSQDPLPLR